MILPPKPGAHIASMASAMPENAVDRTTVATTLQAIFPEEDAEFIHNLVERSGVETRFLVPSIEQVLAPSTFTERNEHYRLAALGLAERACNTALERARTSPEEIDVLIDVSCTGITIPALDVELAPRLGLRSDVRRIPITESGCAAGAVALGLAATFAQGNLNVLIVAVELCSLTLCQGDRSRTNLVAAVIFGDGAGAGVIRPGGPGPRIEAYASHLVPASRDAMGFDVGTHGMRILLQRELPLILSKSLPHVLDSFLTEHGRSRADVGLHLVHPGGRRILDSYEDFFELPEEGLRFSREALRRYGNLSSASILTVMELALQDGFPVPTDQEALLVGVGPGLSFELALISNQD